MLFMLMNVLTYILRRRKMTEFNLEDVLYPRKVWLGNACYRINRKKSDTPKPKMNIPSLKSGYTDNEDLRCHDDNDYDIEVTENGRFRTSIRLPQAFYAQIIGTKGSRRKRLEDETKTDIKIPRQANNNKIVITGATERSVAECRGKLEMIGIDLRNRHQMTHFISIPMVSDQIKENFQKFKELVLAEGHIDGMSESIFQKPEKVHLTIGIMVLLDDSEKQEATELLEKCKREVIMPQLATSKPLIIKMKGLQYMNDDPAQVDVLYAAVKVENHENPDILQKISDDIVEFFYSAGIMRKENDHVKLHATLINTRYRKDGDNDDSGSRSRDRKWRKRISFDARPILKKYADFDFGEQQLDFIHLSHRYAVDKDGYYNPLHKVSCT